MRLSTTLVVLALFAAVAGFYIYLSPRPGKKAGGGGNLPIESMRLLELREGDSLSWLQIHNVAKKTVVTLEYRGNAWQITDPVSYPADEMMAESLAMALRRSNKEKRLTREKDWEEYGLRNPSIKIGVQTLKEGRRRYLYFGDLSPVGHFIYARWEDEDVYFLINADLKKVFDQTVYSLRQKQIFKTPLKDIARIFIRTPAVNYELRKLETSWYWVEPVSLLGEPLEKQDLDLLFSGLQHFFIKDFLDQTQKKKEELGFSLLGPSVEISTEKTGEETLVLGKELPARDAFYGVREGDPVIFLVSKTNLSDFFEELKGMSQQYLARNTGPVSHAA